MSLRSSRQKLNGLKGEKGPSETGVDRFGTRKVPG